MDAQAIASVTIAVVGLTQIVKWAGIPDKGGPIAVMLISLAGVGLWGWSQGTFVRTQTFDYFAAWILVSTSAAGVFGFTRAAVGAVVNVAPPPGGGAGGSPTIK